jgi:hypothetical protein
MPKRNVLAVQVTTDGVAVTGHCRMLKTMVMHSGGSDAIVKYYDRTTAPGGADPFYSINAYGKGLTQVDMPGNGIRFSNGIYIDLPADCNVTVWYEVA